jgi:superfamily I DNA and/or RNA helicase
VGDHRQLPQLLEPEIERELETSGTNEQELLRKSLFERLFMGFKQNPFPDGIPRQVTLDSQYRMHPKLGKFVSEQFYEEHGEAFTSERDEEEFNHNLDRFPDKVAVWIDCPFTMGKEERQQNSSWCRPPEARIVAAVTKDVLDSNPDLGVGVITFYAQQREAIFRELETVGVATRDEQGTREFTDVYRYLKDSSERIRVGTVDAFQGKEFDVVILSLTRSNSFHASPGQEKGLLRKYGFLTLKNRLCVAMSRQKKLLIIVGDSGMVKTTAARDAVPALSAFHELCTDPIYGQIN